MPRLYHSVPLDEEQRHNAEVSEKTIWTSRFDGGVVSSTVERVQKHWIWLLHAILLSASMTLFTLSLCNKTSHISDAMVTERYSAYCMSYAFSAILIES
jgi:hypothetical protein